MITEDIITEIFDMFSSGGQIVDIENGVDSLFTVLSYIGYLDPIVPVGLLIGCGTAIFVWMCICCLIRLAIAFIT